MIVAPCVIRVGNLMGSEDPRIFISHRLSTKLLDQLIMSSGADQAVWQGYRGDLSLHAVEGLRRPRCAAAVEQDWRSERGQLGIVPDAPPRSDPLCIRKSGWRKPVTQWKGLAGAGMCAHHQARSLLQLECS